MADEANQAPKTGAAALVAAATGDLPPPNAAPGKPLSAAARRALIEAEERRTKAEPASELPPEHNGPSGEEPTRYGDWERKGIAVDF